MENALNCANLLVLCRGYGRTAEKIGDSGKTQMVGGILETDKNASTIYYNSAALGSRKQVKKSRQRGNHGTSNAPDISMRISFRSITAVETATFEAAVSNSDQLTKRQSYKKLPPAFQSEWAAYARWSIQTGLTHHVHIS